MHRDGWIRSVSATPWTTQQVGRVWFGIAFGGFVAGYVASALLLTIFAAASGNLKDLSHLESLSVPPWWVTIARPRRPVDRIYRGSLSGQQAPRNRQPGRGHGSAHLAGGMLRSGS